MKKQLSSLIMMLISICSFADWPQFQKNPANQGCDPGVYLDLARMDTVFKFQVGDMVVAAPVIMGDTIYIGASDGRLIAADYKIGGPALWTFQVPIGLAATPAADAGKLYAGGRDGVVYAVDRFTGQEAWRFSVDDTVPAEKEIVAHIKLADGRLYVGACNGRLYCLDLDGGLKWSFGTQFYIKNPPAIKDSIIILSSTDEATYCLKDLGDTCELLWVNRINMVHIGDSAYYTNGTGAATYASPASVGYYATESPRCAPLIVDTHIVLNYAEGELGHATKALSWTRGLATALEDYNNFNTTGFAANPANRFYNNINGFRTDTLGRRFLAVSGYYCKFARSNAAPVVLGNCTVFHSSFYPQGVYFVLNGQASFRDSIAMAGYTVSSSFAAADSTLFFGTYEGYVFGMGTGQSMVTGAADAGKVLLDPVCLSPNPFNPNLTVRFNLARDAAVSIDVYSPDGRLIRTLVRATYPNGRYSVMWNGKDGMQRNVGTGLYVLRMAFGGQTRSLKAMMIK